MVRRLRHGGRHGLHPASWTMVQKTSETILHLATPGGVILVGRGANIVTADLENVFRIRLVGSPERRVERVRRRYELNRKESLSFMAREDKGASYVKKHFGEVIDHPLLYHLTVNTD